MEGKKEPIRPITWFIVATAVIFIAGYFGLQLYQGFQKQMLESESKSKEQQDLLAKQQEELEQAQTAIEGLKNQKPQVIIKEAQPSATSGAQNSSPSLSSIIAYWRGVIVYIECNFRYADTGNIISVSGGSGMAASAGVNNVAILTNKHVVSDEGGYIANDCNIIFPDYDKTYKVLHNQIRTSNNLDSAILIIDNPDNSIINLTSTVNKRCLQKASIGDELVILGYPTIGSQYSITATRGIISGYEGDYYITDAKIEHGNSGGVAILVKDNCYLGIPTFALTGEIESLARILDARIIFDTSK